jgi:regulatory protein
MRKPVRPVTAKSLMNAATLYIDRYPTTAEGLRRVLGRRVQRAERAEAPVVEGVKQVIDAIVAKFVDAGVVDDQAFAQTKARSLHRRGSSTRLTRQKLSVAGIDDDTLDKAMAGLDQELHTDPKQREWQAAVALARRRRIGPFRLKDRPENRNRDLAAMARGGFDYQLAKRVVDAKDVDALDEAQ